MPLHSVIKTDNSSVQIWKTNEEETEFFLAMELSADREASVQSHPKKKVEYRMVRHMQQLELPDSTILYKENGQPYLDCEDVFISISHSYPYAAFAWSQKPVGIDLEQIKSKITRVKGKFLNDNEMQWLPTVDEQEYLTVIWAIKEALYKLHPSKYWSLKKHYEVSPFSLENLANVPCKVFDEHFEDVFTAKVSKVDDCYFALVGG